MSGQYMENIKQVVYTDIMRDTTKHRIILDNAFDIFHA